MLVRGFQFASRSPTEVGIVLEVAKAVGLRIGGELSEELLREILAWLGVTVIRR